MQVNLTTILHFSTLGWEWAYTRRHCFSAGFTQDLHFYMEASEHMTADCSRPTTGATFLFTATLMNSRLCLCINSRTGSVDSRKEISPLPIFSPALQAL